MSYFNPLLQNLEFQNNVGCLSFNQKLENSWNQDKWHWNFPKKFPEDPIKEAL